MMLLTKKIKKTMPALYSTDGVEVCNKQVAVKFFTPWTNWTWFVFEGEEQENGDWEFFGMIHGQTKEMGYFRLSDLTSLRGPFGLKIERDRSVSFDTYNEGKL